MKTVIIFFGPPVTREIIRTHMNDQVRVPPSFTASNEIEFIDLGPEFQSEVSKGVELCYPFDMHWNQAGYNLVARITTN